MADEYESFADKVHQFNCNAAMISHLSHREVEALMTYQREFRNSLRELYKSMSPEAADRFIKPLLTGLADTLPDKG